MKQPTETIKVISAPMPERRRTNKSKELDEQLISLQPTQAIKAPINTRGGWYARAQRLGIKVKVRSISPTHVGVWRVG